LWEHFEEFSLVENMRANGQDQAGFREWLLAMGEGRLPTFDEARKLIKLPDQVVVPAEESLIDRIYGRGPNLILTDDFVRSRCIVCPTNEGCLTINNNVINRLRGPVVELLSVDSVEYESEEERLAANDQFPIEYLHTLMPNGMPPHILRLTEGAMVILLRNINPTIGLCNGTRLFVRQIFPSLLLVEIADGIHRGTRHFIPRFVMIESDAGLPFSIKRIQFPIRVAYAITINKSQGQTFDSVGIDLPEPVFSHGQLYVAFSRCRTIEGVFCRVADNQAQGRRTFTTPNGRVTGVFTINHVIRQALTM